MCIRDRHDTFGSNDLFYRFTGCFGLADSYCGGNKYADHLCLDKDGKVVFSAMDEAFPVSYTPLDVYKRKER